jgi:hypothetical protein
LFSGLDFGWKIQNKTVTDHLKMAAPQQPISAPPAVQPVQAQLQAGNTQRVNWWDTLSKVWPSMEALVELDKRNRIIDGQPLPRPIRRDEDAVKLQLGERRYERELRQFASHGGPDTTNLINVSMMFPIIEMTTGLTLVV